GPAEMIDEVFEAGAGVEAARGWHQVDGGVTERFGLPAGRGVAVDGGPPAGESDHDEGTGSVPITEAPEALEPAAVFGGGEIGGPWGGPADEVGHPDVVATQQVGGIAVPIGEPGGQHRGPEPVGGAD